MTSTRTLAAIVAACAAGRAFAQAAPAETSASIGAAPGLLQTTLGLAVVLALIFGASWLLRRLLPAGRSGAVIRIVATQPLGQRERVVLIEIGEQWLLLGVAPGSVNALQTLPKGTVPAAPSASPFARLLAATRTAPPQ